MGLITAHGPNSALVTHAPGDTSWNAVTLPPGVTGRSAGATVTITCMDSTEVANGSIILLNFNLSAAPSHGFPLRAGDTFSRVMPGGSIWIKLAAATDVVQLLFT